MGAVKGFSIQSLKIFLSFSLSEGLASASNMSIDKTTQNKVNGFLGREVGVRFLQTNCRDENELIGVDNYSQI
jgi:hypothetical protein